jgi:hypothetical protein
MTSQNQAERKVGYYNGTALGWRRDRTNKTHRKGKKAYKFFAARARRILDKVLSRNDKE